MTLKTSSRHRFSLGGRRLLAACLAWCLTLLGSWGCAAAQGNGGCDVAGTQAEPKPFYMSLKTNLLYDALAVPSVGVEFYVGRGLSVGADWMYAWWSKERRHRYWRIYGGDINLRYRFGHAAKAKPFTGHFVGVYAGAFTFDFEFGGTAYMGGRPGHNLWNRCILNVGVEYGYSLPIGRRLNLDFAVGVGYIGGKVEKFRPEDGYYIWEKTAMRHWFGPTKAEVSLVWLLGRGNTNLRGKKQECCHHADEEEGGCR